MNYQHTEVVAVIMSWTMETIVIKSKSSDLGFLKAQIN